MSRTSGSRDLVTGGAGFIGSHLVDHLRENGREVVVLDDFSTGRPENLAHRVTDGGLRLIRGDVADERALADAMDGCARVFHMAAAVGVRRVVDDPLGSMRNNVRGADAVFRHAAEREMKVIFASTSEVYGRSERERFREDADVALGPTTSPRWSYACAKALDEWMALAWHRQHGLPVVVARVFNTVGPRQSDRWGMVLPNFVRAARAGHALLVHGDGRQQRCFAHVSETVRALAALAESPTATGRVFNVGSDREIAIGDLAALVIRVTGSRSAIEHVPHARVFGADFEDMPRRVPDLARLRAEVGFAPDRAIEDIVRELAG